VSNDNAKAIDKFNVGMDAGHGLGDVSGIVGHFVAECRDEEGHVLWVEEFDNLLTQVGKALLLDMGLAGSAYTAADFMGLISSVSFSAISGGDTMSAHAGWLEAGTTNVPTYSGARPTTAWNASTLSGASAYSASKQLTAGLVFTFTGTGTVQGAFIVAGSGANGTIGNTAGVLFAAGTFTTPQPVVATNTLTVTYSATLT
jgi:hypothetical protein